MAPAKNLRPDGEIFVKRSELVAGSLRGNDEGVFETGFVPEASHRPYFATKAVALWLEKQIDFHWD